MIKAAHWDLLAYQIQVSDMISYCVDMTDILSKSESMWKRMSLHTAVFWWNLFYANRYCICLPHVRRKSFNWGANGYFHRWKWLSSFSLQEISAFMSETICMKNRFWLGGGHMNSCTNLCLKMQCKGQMIKEKRCSRKTWNYSNTILC